MLDETSDSPNASAPTATPELTTEQAAYVSTLLLKGIEAAHTLTQPDLMRLNASTISYLDRLVVLAGGALTIVFTVIANLSTLLHVNHLNANRPGFLVMSCWSFVVCILSGLLATWTAIKAQGKQLLQTGISKIDSSIKTGLLEKNPAVDLSKYQGFAGAFAEHIQTKRHTLAAALFNVIAHVSLVLAFAFLAWFVQWNSRLLLNVR